MQPKTPLHFHHNPKLLIVEEIISQATKIQLRKAKASLITSLQEI
jgi:hypothetical protein